MKKYLLFAAAALTLAACSNDENMDGPVAIRLSSSLEVQTRAAADIQGSAFAENEQVDVFITEAVEAGQTATTVYPQPLTYVTGTGGAMTPLAGSQPYFPTSGRGVYIHAYYPAGVAKDMAEATTVEFSVKPDQSSAADYKASDLMFGQAANPVSRQSDAVPVTFRHLLSKVTVTLEAGAGLTDTGLDGAKVELLDVLPTTTLTTSTGAISAASGTATDITVFTATSTALSGSTIVVPQQLPARFVRVTLAAGGVLIGTLSDSSQPNLAGGNAYTYTITVNLTALNISASITPWTTNEGSGEAVMK